MIRKRSSMPSALPSPPLLYRTQWLECPAPAARSLSQGFSGKDFAMPFFQDFDELDERRRAQKEVCAMPPPPASMSDDGYLQYALLQTQQDQTALLAIKSKHKHHKHKQSSLSASRKTSMKTASSHDSERRPSLAATPPEPCQQRMICEPETNRKNRHSMTLSYNHLSSDIPLQHESTDAALPRYDKPPFGVTQFTSKQRPPIRAVETAVLHPSKKWMLFTGEERISPHAHTCVDDSGISPGSQTIHHLFTSARGVCADTAHLPLIPMEDPHLLEPRAKHLRCDTDVDTANLVSPVFLTTLPFGSVIETANMYPDARCEICQLHAVGRRATCVVHGCEAGTQGFTPHASLRMDGA